MAGPPVPRSKVPGFAHKFLFPSKSKTFLPFKLREPVAGPAVPDCLRFMLLPLLSAQPVTGLPVMVLLSAASNHNFNPGRLVGDHAASGERPPEVVLPVPSSIFHQATKPLVLGPLVKSVVKILETVPRPLESVAAPSDTRMLTSDGTFCAVTVKVY